MMFLIIIPIFVLVILFLTHKRLDSKIYKTFTFIFEIITLFILIYCIHGYLGCKYDCTSMADNKCISYCNGYIGLSIIMILQMIFIFLEYYFLELRKK